MIQFQNYIIIGHNLRPLMIEEEKREISTSLTFNNIIFIALEDELQLLMIQFCII